MELDLTAIRVEMAKNNINQNELARLANLRTATVSNIMTGKSKGTVDTWAKISKALNVDVSDIVKETIIN